jgi:hypothetical protein
VCDRDTVGTPSIFKVIRSATVLTRIFANLGFEVGGERRAAEVELDTGRLRNLNSRNCKKAVNFPELVVFGCCGVCLFAAE